MVRYQAIYVVFIGLMQLCSGLALATSSELHGEVREDYQQALTAIKRGGWTDYEKIRSGLDTYPLAIYLDYFKLSSNVSQVRPAEAQRFVSLSQDSPLPNRFLATYLMRAGKDARWQDFLAVMPEEPNTVELKCYYFRAKLAAGDTLGAWEGAERLWVYGKSRPRECDPLFTAWLKAEALGDDVVWARMLKAFDARQRSLMTYVARKGSDQLQPWSDILLAVYRQPDRLSQHKLPVSSPYSADIASHGVAYLAKYNPVMALQQWRNYQRHLTFTAAQTRQAEYAIALRSLFARTEANVPWLTQSLASLGEDKLVEIRLRWALAEMDWQAVESTLPLLSQGRVSDSVWRFWRAMVDEHRGDTAAANKAFEALALERGYYSFLAADRLGKAYALNNQPIAPEPEVLEPLKMIPAVRRVEELVFHQEDRLAHSEWFNMLESENEQNQEDLAVLAYQQGWHRMAIDAANKARAWDRLDLRFPMPWQDTFAHYATLQQVPSTELMAIARRESAFFPQANSPVGARGLMQIMPATGKQVASAIGERHSTADLYEVDHNVLLGSAYYKQLLERYDGNRVFALAAYNAGPHRVDRWRHKSGESVPVEIWIETIPYEETRNYVQAVLSYNVVFQQLMGEDRGILTAAELHAGY